MHDVITLPDEAEGWWFLTVFMGDVTPQETESISFHTTGTVNSGRSCVNIDYLCLKSCDKVL